MSAIDVLWIVPLMLLLLLLKGFFSGSEIALVNADKIKLSHRAKQGHKGSRMVLGLFKRPEQLLTTTLVGTNIATVGLTTLGTLIMIHFFGNELGDLYAFLVLTPLLLILGEIVPKSVCQQKSDAIAAIVVFPLRGFSLLLSPIVFVFSRIARFAASLAGRRSSAQHLFVTRDQLRTVMEMAERASDTEVFDRFRIERAIRFADMSVGEEMIPVAEMVAISGDRTMQDVVRIVHRRGYNRLPVYAGNVSNVTGICMLTTWDLLDPQIEQKPLEAFVKPAHYVSRYETLDELLPVLRERDDHMAIVLDEYGSAIGMITMEDVVEAVVGDIDVGYDFEEYLPRLTRKYEVLEDGAYLMDARLPISEVNDVLGLDLRATAFHTVGGMVLWHLRHLARAGDYVVEAGYRFTVAEATERRINKVRVERESFQSNKRKD
ncbi:MAG: HlyC/CorC family transporter [Candidatus Eiseniibacteriota bacterium]|nr:MAG: HlyC/CorC family transporter [Candidatus Eisenbacteria bacterium]